MPKWLRQSLANAGYKVLALFLALIGWFIVQGEEVLEVTYRTQIHIKAPEGLIVKGGAVKTRDVTLRGPRALVGHYSSAGIRELSLEPKASKPGPVRLYLDRNEFPEISSRINVLIPDPAINVVLDELAHAKVPIQEVLHGTPAEGYQIERIDIRPASVDVTGPRSDLQTMRHIATEPIDVRGLQQSRSVEVSLAVPLGEDVQVELPKVTVTLQIGERKINKEFDGIPIDIVGTEYLGSTRPKYVSIVIQGTPGVLSFVKREDLRAFVEASNLAPGSHDKDILVRIPQDTVLIESTPSRATLDLYTQKRSP